jgi:hypothetical protein
VIAAALELVFTASKHAQAATATFSDGLERNLCPQLNEPRWKPVRADSAEVRVSKGCIRITEMCLIENVEEIRLYS